MFQFIGIAPYTVSPKMEHKMTVVDVLYMMVWLLAYVVCCVLSLIFNRFVDRIPFICKIGI